MLGLRHCIWRETLLGAFGLRVPFLGGKFIFNRNFLTRFFNRFCADRGVTLRKSSLRFLILVLVVMSYGPGVPCRAVELCDRLLGRVAVSKFFNTPKSVAAEATKAAALESEPSSKTATEDVGTSWSKPGTSGDAEAMILSVMHRAASLGVVETFLALMTAFAQIVPNEIQDPIARASAHHRYQFVRTINPLRRSHVTTDQAFRRILLPTNTPKNLREASEQIWSFLVAIETLRFKTRLFRPWMRPWVADLPLAAEQRHLESLESEMDSISSQETASMPQLRATEQQLGPIGYAQSLVEAMAESDLYLLNMLKVLHSFDPDFQPLPRKDSWRVVDYLGLLLFATDTHRRHKLNVEFIEGLPNNPEEAFAWVRMKLQQRFGVLATVNWSVRYLVVSMIALQLASAPVVLHQIFTDGSWERAWQLMDQAATQMDDDFKQDDFNAEYLRTLEKIRALKRH